MSASTLNAKSVDLGTPDAGKLALCVQPGPEKLIETKNDRRYRVIRGHWMPDKEREVRPANATKEQLLETYEREDARWEEAIEDYPAPSSLLDIPPNSSWGNEDEEVPAPMTREEALRQAAILNRDRIERCECFRCIEWCNVAEILEHYETTHFLAIGDGHMYEERAARFKIRLVEPTAAEHERYGDPAFVARIIGAQTT